MNCGWEMMIWQTERKALMRLSLTCCSSTAIGEQLPATSGLRRVFVQSAAWNLNLPGLIFVQLWVSGLLQAFVQLWVFESLRVSVRSAVWSWS